MDDILASIRNILNEDEHAPLQLTEAMLVSPPSTEVSKLPPAEPSKSQNASLETPPVANAMPAQTDPAGLTAAGQGLLGPVAAAAAAAALGELARTVASNRQAALQRHSGPSIEDVVREEMRPLLREWLDRHLPTMVERLVRQEIEKVMGQGGPS